MSRLTSRERDVLRLVARGYTYAGAAERLGLSAHTVASHIKKIYRKLGANTAASAVMRAVELGLLAIPTIR
jgi:DNA-binding CsgD family transcriptional regulator